MIYDESLSYDEPYFQYNGVRIVSPQAISPTFAIDNPKVLAVLLIAPVSIDSTLVFVDTHQVVIPSGVIEVTDSSSSMSFSTLNNQEGYIVFSVLEDEAFALTQAETIVLDQNSAGTVDVTIIPTA